MTNSLSENLDLELLLTKRLDAADRQDFDAFQGTQQEMRDYLYDEVRHDRMRVKDAIITEAAGGPGVIIAGCADCWNDQGTPHGADSATLVDVNDAKIGHFCQNCKLEFRPEGYRRVFDLTRGTVGYICPHIDDHGRMA